MTTATPPIVTQPRPEIVQSPSGPLTFKMVPLRLQPSFIHAGVSVVTARAERRPTKILLGTLTDPGFRVIEPIAADIEDVDGSVVASWRDIEEFGTGSTVTSAIEDLGRTIAELYRALLNDSEKLGPDLQQVWQILQTHVVPRR